MGSLGVYQGYVRLTWGSYPPQEENMILLYKSKKSLCTPNSVQRIPNIDAELRLWPTPMITKVETQLTMLIFCERVG